MKYYFGIDLGGTNIVAGVVDENYNIISKASTKTNLPRPEKEIADDMAKVSVQAVKEAGISMEQIEWVGIGTPGIANSEKGIIEYSCNLGFNNTPMVEYIKKSIDKPVFIENDANAAAYGEYVAGAAKGAKNAVCITLGTGVGGGIIIDGKIYSGSNFAGAEIGHTVIEVDGPQCACGRKGCFEAYASATGLIRMAKEAMAQHPESLLHATAAEVGDVNGQTIFRAKEQGDPTAVAVVERYIHYLSVGIANVINCFYPEVVALSGGIANQGEALLAPLREAVAPQVYGNQYLQTHTRILGCTLGYHAGIIGAAMLPTAL